MKSRLACLSAILCVVACSDAPMPTRDSEARSAKVTDFAYWATTAPLSGAVVRLRATLSEPADCVMTHARSTRNPEPGLTFMYETARDGTWIFRGGSTTGGDLLRLQAQAADIDQRVETGTLDGDVWTEQSFAAQSEVEFLALARSLQPSTDAQSFSPGYSLAWRLGCSAPFTLVVDQGDQTLIRSFFELEGDGLQSGPATAAVVSESIDLRGTESGYLLLHTATTGGGRAEITHPGGTETILLLPRLQLIETRSSTEPGPHALTIEYAASELNIAPSLYVGLFAFDPALTLPPGRLAQDVIRDPPPAPAGPL